jgi:hypothetical protein
MMRKSKTVSLTLPIWVVEFFDNYQWEVHVPKPELMRRVVTEFVKMKIEESEEASHPSPGPFESSDTEES